MKTIVLTLLGGAALGSVLALTGGRPVGAPLPAPSAEHSCKPQAPIAVELVQLDEAAGRVTLELSLRPVIELTGLSWTLSLPAGASLVEGPASGVGAPARGALTRERGVVALPGDSRHQRVLVEANGHFEGSDQDGPSGPETIVASAALNWGSPEPDAPTALTVDPLSGEAELSVVLPSRRVARKEAR